MQHSVRHNQTERTPLKNVVKTENERRVEQAADGLAENKRDVE